MIANSNTDVSRNIIIVEDVVDGTFSQSGWLSFLTTGLLDLMFSIPPTSSPERRSRKSPWASEFAIHPKAELPHRKDSALSCFPGLAMVGPERAHQGVVLPRILHEETEVAEEESLLPSKVRSVHRRHQFPRPHLATVRHTRGHNICSRTWKIPH